MVALESWVQRLEVAHGPLKISKWFWSLWMGDRTRMIEHGRYFSKPTMRNKETRFVCNVPGEIIDWSVSSTITAPFLLLFLLCLHSFPVLFASIIVLPTESTNSTSTSTITHDCRVNISQHSNSFSNSILVIKAFVVVGPPHSRKK